MFAKLYTTCSRYSTLWKNNTHLNLLNSNNVPSLDHVRNAARKGKRAALLAAKRAKKLSEANKPTPVPKYLQKKAFVGGLDRKRCTNENWPAIKPTDNIYSLRIYRGQPFTFESAIVGHRYDHSKAVLNDPSALVYVCIELELKKKKKDQYLAEFQGMINFKHDFLIQRENRIIAICNDPEDQVKATNAGAIYSGAKELIKRILDGAISTEEFDYVICHLDMYKELTALRGILKNRYPTAKNGLLRLDIDKGVEKFSKVKEYRLNRSSSEPDFGWVDMCFGRLDMPLEHLEENLRHALNTVETNKPLGMEDIPFILRTLIFCEKTRSWNFMETKIAHWNYLSHYADPEKQLEEAKINVNF